MRRVLLVVTVAIVMAVMMLAMAMPAFARAANPCEGNTPASPPDEGGAPSLAPPETPPGGSVREPPPVQSRARSPFTGPTDRGSCGA